MSAKKLEPWPDCPVQEALKQVEEACYDLKRTIREVRRNLRECEKCEEVEDCWILKEIHQVLDQVIEDVLKEWGLL